MSTATTTTVLELVQRHQLTLDASARLSNSAASASASPSRKSTDDDDDEEVESHRIVINAKLIDEAVKRCSTPVLFVETDEARSHLPALYNDLWDAALCHKKTSLDCRVVDVSSTAPASRDISVKRAKKSDVTVINMDSLADILVDELKMPYCLYDNPRQALPKLPVVAMGGTFDRLHNGAFCIFAKGVCLTSSKIVSGHKKLLSVALQVAVKAVIVGVTAPSMLQGKKNASIIQDLDTRLARLREFCDSIVPPGVQVEIVVIDDPWGPALSRSDVQGIVVSSETLRGAKLINDQRLAKGYAPLTPVLVLRSNQYVLSSTFVRTLL